MSFRSKVLASFLVILLMAAFSVSAQTISAPSAYVTGVGEATDGYHAATPHPEGIGAKLAMQRALGSAQLEPDQIDYLSLHGTGTPANDLSEPPWRRPGVSLPRHENEGDCRRAHH